MLRKLGLGIAYLIAIGYTLLILLPALYCLQHGCKSGGEGDIFMPAFFLSPYGAIATAFSLLHAARQIRKRQSWSWLFCPLAIIFAVVLLATLAFFALLIYHLASHR